MSKSCVTTARSLASATLSLQIDARRSLSYRILSYCVDCLNTSNNSVDMACPCCQSGAHFGFISGKVIDAGHSRPMAANVVEHRLDDMRQHSQSIGHRCRGSTTKIVHPPFGHGSDRFPDPGPLFALSE